jgi:hypothetical protein
LPTTPPTFLQQKSSDRPELIDINSASKEQLLTLPGIDESRAEKIIETRPYKNKKELKKKKIVPEEVYKQISDKITDAASTGDSKCPSGPPNSTTRIIEGRSRKPSDSGPSIAHTRDRHSTARNEDTSNALPRPCVRSHTRNTNSDSQNRHSDA